MNNRTKETIEDFCQFFIFFCVSIYPIAIAMMSMFFGFIVLLQYLFGPASGHHITLCIWTSMLFISVFVIRVRKNHLFSDLFFKITYILVGGYHWFNTLKSLNSYTIAGEIDPLIPLDNIQDYFNGIEKAIILCITILFVSLIIEGSLHIFYTWKDKRPLFKTLWRY